MAKQLKTDWELYEVNVLIDIEWVEENGVLSITQFAAVRVTGDWRAAAIFDRLICPEKHWEVDWEHMAYSGYAPDEFRTGVSEKDCIADFIEFLDDSDTILCWQKDTKRVLMQKAGQFLGKPLPVKCECVDQAVYAAARAKGVEARGLYEMADEIGITTPVPRHRSVNDAAVLLSLLSAFGYDKMAVREAAREAPKGMADRRARNADILSRVQYNYIYTPSSKVFHRPSCHLMRNAVSINGCIYYKTAVNGRVPCRICHPEPNERQITAKTKEGREPGASPRPIEKKVVSARLLGDKWIEITNVKIVGYCHNLIHPGMMTRKIMEEHDCVGKNCKFFEKYAESTYWAAEEDRKRQKEHRRQKRQAEKEALRKLEDELAELKDLFQSYADDAGYAMRIVRLEKERPNRYRVFYVSENPFADGNRFPDLLDAIKFFFPQYAIQLRHIKNVDGRFVTIGEYLSRRR